MLIHPLYVVWHWQCCGATCGCGLDTCGLDLGFGDRALGLDLGQLALEVMALLTSLK